jgi:hypothetical protein
MFNISKEKLYELDFPVPPIELQQKFASIVADTESLRQKQKQNEARIGKSFSILASKVFWIVRYEKMYTICISTGISQIPYGKTGSVRKGKGWS